MNPLAGVGSKFAAVLAKLQTQIPPADGVTPMVGSGQDGLATFDDLVKEAATQYPSLFQTNGAPADTSPSGQRPNTGTKTISRKDSTHSIRSSATERS